MLLGLDTGTATRPTGSGRAFFEEVEPRYEDSALVCYLAHSDDCACSRRNTGKATDRRREAARSDEAEGARWLQARRNGQRNEALGGRMRGGAGAKNRYASRRVESDVDPRRGGWGHSEGSAVTLRLCAISTQLRPTKLRSSRYSES